MIKVTTENTTTFYDSLDDFIDNFPFAERQCTFQIECELRRNGFAKISDYDCPIDYILTWDDEME